MKSDNNTTTYVNKIGDTTFIIGNSFTGTKTLADTFEEIIIAAFRRENNLQYEECA